MTVSKEPWMTFKGKLFINLQSSCSGLPETNMSNARAGGYPHHSSGSWNYSDCPSPHHAWYDTHRRDPMTAPRQPVEWSRRALAVGGGGPPVAVSTRANLLHKTAFTTWTGVRAREKACTLNNRVRKPKPEISKTTESVSHSVV